MSNDSKLSKWANVATIVGVPLAIIGLIFTYQSLKQGDITPQVPESVIDTFKVKTKIEPQKTTTTKSEPKEVITKPSKPKKERETTSTTVAKSDPKPSNKSKPTINQITEQPVTSTKTNPSTKPISKPEPSTPKPSTQSTPNYLSATQPYDIAILSKTKKSNIENLFKTHFKSKGFKSSSSVIKSSFKSTAYFKNLEEDASGLKAIGLEKTINCICLIDEKIRFDKNEQFGTAYLKATGNYAIAIIDINSGEIDNYNIETIGSGTSESLATASVHEHLIENKNFKNINIDLCKK